MTSPKLCTFGGLKEGDLYIERPADHELLAALRRGEYAYVLSSRQTGKTSLMLRTIRKLRGEGVRCVKIDLGSLGSDAGPDAWYESMAVEIADGLGLDDGFVDACFARWSRSTSVHRFLRFLRETVAQSERPLVLFIDEIEGFLKLPMRLADDFLAGIRTLFNDRDREPLYRRLAFCVMGVCTPTELIRDERRTPFNVARGISLEDFRWEELRAGFLPVLRDVTDAEAVLRRIFEWTNGHPYLTHRLVQDWTKHASAGGSVEASWIDRTVRDQYMGSLGREQENFLEVERRLCLGQAYRARQRLSLYRSIRQGKLIPARGQDPVQLELRLTGLVRESRLENGDVVLAVRNRIFAELFDVSWAPKLDPCKLDAALWMKEQTERWQDFGRVDAFVLRGEELFEAQGWAEQQTSIDQETREFLAASERVDGRERAIRLYSLLWTLLWSSFANFLVVPLLSAYWKYRAYAGQELLPSLYGLPFVFALPAGLLADRLHISSATVLLGGLGLISAGLLTLLADFLLPLRGLAFAAVLFVLMGQVLQRPQVAVLVGRLYPRSDRRLDLTYVAYYVFVNLGALLGPLIGAAAFRLYGWRGLLATAAGGSAFALYSFAAARRVFQTLNVPLRPEPLESPQQSLRRRGAMVRLAVTMLVFWVAFYALGNALAPAASSGSGTDGKTGFLPEDLLLQGLSSEAVTPLFVFGVAPILAMLTLLIRRWHREPPAPTKIALGLLLVAGLLLTRGLIARPQVAPLATCVVLTFAELLIVPASMSMTTALSSAKALSATMGGYFLIMGVGAWVTDLYPIPPRLLLPMLAVAAMLSAAMLMVRRRSWAALFPRTGVV